MQDLFPYFGRRQKKCGCSLTATNSPLHPFLPGALLNLGGPWVVSGITYWLGKKSTVQTTWVPSLSWWIALCPPHLRPLSIIPICTTPLKTKLGCSSPQQFTSSAINFNRWHCHVPATTWPYLTRSLASGLVFFLSPAWLHYTYVASRSLASSPLVTFTSQGLWLQGASGGV